MQTFRIAHFLCGIMISYSKQHTTFTCNAMLLNCFVHTKMYSIFVVVIVWFLFCMGVEF